jgi:hypothetical protein
MDLEGPQRADAQRARGRGARRLDRVLSGESRPGALQQYQRLTRALDAELKTRPSAESAALYYRLRQGEPV